ncbi:hypothetical protein GIB67_021289 [Kingdonia uniflora]|uniref:Uncharacterized protein n=1 Tax=Kingdonia uniflora TaxID=39325 RepID=A0A7J7P9M3_9MAGN|nr:hypothetical protein GIB67_021289 [Kingdonia uniflora]
MIKVYFFFFFFHNEVDNEVNEQVDEENQTHEGRAKKGTSNAKNYTSRCTDLRLHKMFAALPEEEKGILRATCFVPLLLIDTIARMSMLVVEIFDRHLEDVLRLNLLKIILSFLLPNKGRNVWVKYVDLVDDQQQFNRFPEYQFSTPEKTTKYKREGGNEKEDRKRKKAEPRTKKEGLEVVNELMVDDDVEVGSEVNFNVISSEYSGDLLEGCAEVAKTGNSILQPGRSWLENLSGINYRGAQTEVVISPRRKMLVKLVRVNRVKRVEQNKEEVVEARMMRWKLQNKPDCEQLVLMESEVDVTLQKRHALTKEEINERAFKMACQSTNCMLTLTSFFWECYWNLLFIDQSPG